jgi:stage IV sporulation protein FB
MFYFTLSGMLTKITVVFLTVLFHELAHTMSALQKGLEIEEVELLPFGGVAKLKGLLKIDPWVEMSIAICGPVFNLIMAVIVYFFYTNEVLKHSLTPFLIKTNVYIALFNLIPALPLDGGRVLRSCLALILGYRKATNITVFLGKGLSLFLLLLGIYLINIGEFNPILLLLSPFLFFAAEREKSIYPYYFIKNLSTNSKKLADEAIEARQIIAKMDMPARKVLNRLVSNKYHIIVVLDERHRIKYQLTETQFIEGLIKHGFYCKVYDIIKKT